MGKVVVAIQMSYTGKQIELFPRRQHGGHLNEELVREAVLWTHLGARPNNPNRKQWACLWGHLK